MSFNVNNNNNTQQAQYKTLKLKGSKQQLNLNKLEGLRLTEQHEGLKKYDENKDGILQKNEIDKLAKELEGAAGNSKLSKRETKKTFGDKSVFESIKALAEQQETLETQGSYTEVCGNKSTHVFKDNEGVYSYVKTTAEDGTVTTVTDDGTKEVFLKDGSKEITDPNGKTIKYDKNGKRVSITQDGNITTFPDDNTTVTKNSDGKIIQTVKSNNGEIVNTKFEYQDGKTIEREYSDIGEDAPLTSITVRTQKDGHKFDTKFASEEDMKNNRPSEMITDAHNPSQKTITKYTYDDKGNVKAETTDSAGNKTIKHFNANGEEISNPNPPKTHTVVKGESITQIVKNALSQQGIENPTKEELQAAKKEFLELNKDIVKTYNGVKKEWKGNKFFYPDDVVKIPNFNKTEDTPKTVETEETLETIETEETPETIETEDTPETTTVKASPQTPDNKELTEDAINQKLDSLKPGESFTYTRESGIKGMSYNQETITWTKNEDGTYTKTEPKVVNFNDGGSEVVECSTRYAADRQTVISYQKPAERLHFANELVSTINIENGKEVNYTTDISNLKDDLSPFGRRGDATPYDRLMSSISQQSEKAQAKFSSQEIKNTNGETIISFQDGKFIDNNGKEISYQEAVQTIYDLDQKKELGSFVQTLKTEDALKTSTPTNETAAETSSVKDNNGYDIKNDATFINLTSDISNLETQLQELENKYGLEQGKPDIKKMGDDYKTYRNTQYKLQKLENAKSMYESKMSNWQENGISQITINGVSYDAKMLTLSNGQRAYEIDGSLYEVNINGFPGDLISE